MAFLKHDGILEKRLATNLTCNVGTKSRRTVRIFNLSSSQSSSVDSKTFHCGDIVTTDGYWRLTMMESSGHCFDLGSTQETLCWLKVWNKHLGMLLTPPRQLRMRSSRVLVS